MVWKGFLLLFLILMPNQTQASSGLAFLFFYACKADEIHEKTVHACTFMYPELKVRGEAALESWRQKKADDIKLLSEACDADLRKNFPTESQREKTWAQIEQIINQYIDNNIRKIQKEGITVCEEYLTILDHAGDDILRIFPPP